MNKRTLTVLLLGATVGIVAVVFVRIPVWSVFGEATSAKTETDVGQPAPTPADNSALDCNDVRAELAAIRLKVGGAERPSFDYDCDKGSILVRVSVLESWLDKTDTATVKTTLRSYGILISRALSENKKLHRLITTKTAKCMVDFYTVRNEKETPIATFDLDKDELVLK